VLEVYDDESFCVDPLSPYTGIKWYPSPMSLCGW
jgi:hypothetical protein